MSFSIALSGLNASNSELNTISNNIANIETTGYKETRTEFAAVYNANSANGVEVSGTSQNFDNIGNITRTGRSLDLAISGQGFFLTEDAKGQTLYTRSGIFELASNGTLVSNAGHALQGYSVDPNNELQSGVVGDIEINTSPIQADATENLDFVANLDSRENVITTAFDPTDSTTFNHSYTTLVYDSLGNTHTLNQYFVKTAGNTWQVYARVDGGATNVGTTTLVFNSDGSLQSPVTPADVNYNIAATAADLGGNVEPMNIKITVTGSTQFGSDYAVSTNSPDGFSAGDFVSVTVEDNGMIFATYTNGQSQLQGQVILANFVSPQELAKVSDTAWVRTFASGAPIVNTPGVGILGDIASGSLESSNVDLTSELVNLMTAQRNYQANTKTISTYDQLTQALFNAV